MADLRLVFGRVRDGSSSLLSDSLADWLLFPLASDEEVVEFPGSTVAASPTTVPRGCTG